MSDRELLELLVTNMEKLGEKMSGVGTAVGALDDRMSGVETAVGALDDRMSGVETAVGALNDRMSGVETAVGALDDRMSGVETAVGALNDRMSGVETAVGALDDRVLNLEFNVEEIKLTLENETNPNISLIGEGHLDLMRELKLVNVGSAEKEMLGIRVNVLQADVDKLKNWRTEVERTGSIPKQIKRIEKAVGEVGL